MVTKLLVHGWPVTQRMTGRYVLTVSLLSRGTQIPEFAELFVLSAARHPAFAPRGE